MKDLKDVKGVSDGAEPREFSLLGRDCGCVIKNEIRKNCKVEATIVMNYAYKLCLSERIFSVKLGSGLLSKLFGRELASVYEQCETKLVEIYDQNVAGAIYAAVRMLNRAGQNMHYINLFRA